MWKYNRKTTVQELLYGRNYLYCYSAHYFLLIWLKNDNEEKEM